MVSPELLRRYPFFGGLNDAQIRDISMITEEVEFAKGEVIITESQPANKLCILVDGSIDLVFRSSDELNLASVPAKELNAGEVNPGDVFGISALVEPHVYTTTARTAANSQVIVIDAVEFRKLIEKDINLSNLILKKMLQIISERLNSTRVQLAACQL